MSIERHITDQDSYDDALDHLVDTVPMSYHDAKLALNLPQFEEDTSGTEKEVETSEPKLHRPGRVMGTRAVRSAAERRARMAAAHGPQHSEDARVGYEGGALPEERSVAEVIALRDDPERRRIYTEGRALVEAALAAARDRKNIS